MLAAGGQMPDEPAIYRAEQQLAPLRLLLRAGDAVEQPANFGPGKIRVEQQARTGAECRFMPFGLQPLADGVRLPGLPYDRVGDRLAGCFVPDDGRFALVRNADARDLREGNASLLHGIAHRLQRGVP